MICLQVLLPSLHDGCLQGYETCLPFMFQNYWYEAKNVMDQLFNNRGSLIGPPQNNYCIYCELYKLELRLLKNFKSFHRDFTDVPKIEICA